MEEGDNMNVESSYPLLEENKRCSCSWLIFVYLLSAVSMISAITIIVWWMYGADNSGVSVEIISRKSWGAEYVDPQHYHNLKVYPPTHVVILQTNTRECYNLEECSQLIQTLQKTDIQYKKYDIISNFLIGSDGHVYEGRGWGIAGVYAAKIQDKSVGIAIIGNYEGVQPSGKILKICQLLIEEAVQRKKLNPNYKLLGVNQVSDLLLGDMLFNAIKQWKHWEDCTLKLC